MEVAFRDCSKLTWAGNEVANVNRHGSYVALPKEIYYQTLQLRCVQLHNFPIFIYNCFKVYKGEECGCSHEERFTRQRED